ncbi:MAG: pyrimidine-nucleoside phosphorylase [Firmicutes bacterium]|nr:pyrimidine-nucleoside phosphorylase [Bacillota bacterium]MDY2921036.1 pyrimidine-nucleoside phosphorylase [Lentihominibacter sp.]
MNTLDIITKKRDGGSLSEAEIRYLTEGCVSGEIPDYQMAAFLMAVYFRGLNREEIFALTKAMRDSGDVADLSQVAGFKVDKHSTGGVGDKTTLIVAPIASACGVPVAKMSGRGLGFTGGTVDKLESVPGFRTALTRDEFVNQVNRTGIAVIGQSETIALADKKLYALRDVTATVENMGLIASSIMSKKLASGSDGILLDVKWGRGAFMKTVEDARELAELMVDIGRSAGRKTMAMITDMNQPLGRAVGNSLEVREAIDVLRGEGPADIYELSLRLASEMISMSLNISPEEAEARARAAVDEGRALGKFREFVEAQGGDGGIIENPLLMGEARFSESIRAGDNGYIEEIDALKIGMASQHTGAGREKKEDVIDKCAGILLTRKRGDEVKTGDELCRVFAGTQEKLEQASAICREAFEIGENKPSGRELIEEIIGR